MAGEPILITHPDVAAQWDDVKNADAFPGRSPGNVTHGSAIIAHWVHVTPDGRTHSWAARVKHRTRKVHPSGCPHCSGTRRQPGPGESLADVYPEIAAEWHPTRNGGVTPCDVLPGSSKAPVWWCHVCRDGVTREWAATVKSRALDGARCGHCFGTKEAPLVGESLADMYPGIAAEWHPTLNGDVTPDQVHPFANMDAWWCHTLPGGVVHEWEGLVLNRARGTSNCTICSGRSRRRYGKRRPRDTRPGTVEESLTVTHPHVAAEWHPTLNGDVSPSDVTYGSHRPVWWQHVTVDGTVHEWKARVRHRARGAGCRICHGPFRVPSRAGSLLAVNPELAAEWDLSRNGDLTPRDVFPSSHRKVWWEHTGPGGVVHSWEASVSNRSAGHGCPTCNRGGPVTVR